MLSWSFKLKQGGAYPIAPRTFIFKWRKALDYLAVLLAPPLVTFGLFIFFVALIQFAGLWGTAVYLRPTGHPGRPYALICNSALPQQHAIISSIVLLGLQICIQLYQTTINLPALLPVFSK